MTLFAIGFEFEKLRKVCNEWKFRARKAEVELEELRMRLH